MDTVSYITAGSGFTSPTQSTAGVQAQSDKVARYVYDLLAVSQSHRKTVDMYWAEYYRMYRSQQWPQRRFAKGQDWRAFLTVNYTHAIIESFLAVLFDNKPRTVMKPRSQHQQAYTSTMQSCWDSVWERRRLLRTCKMAQKNSFIYGTGIAKLWYNPALEQGLGDIDGGVVPTEYFFPDPDATDVWDAFFLIEARPVPLSYLKRQFGEKAKRVRPDSLVGQAFRNQQGGRGNPTNALFDPNAPMQWYSPVGDNPLVADQTEFSSPPYRPAVNMELYATLVECWVQDDTEELVSVETVQLNPLTGQPAIITEQYKRPKYPYGRLIHVAGGETLSDRPSPYRMWPYVRFVDIEMPGEFWGLGEVELLRDLQIELNKRRSQLIDNAAMCGNVIWIVDKDSGVTRESLTNRPGLIVEKMAGRQVERVSPPQIPGWQWQMVQLAIQDMREISGASVAALSGAPVKGARSGHAMEAGMAQQTTRIRMKGQNLDQSLEDMTRIGISHMQQFYTTGRVVRIIGWDGFEVFVPFDGQHIRGDWDIGVETSASAMMSKSARAQQSIEMYKLKAIDRRALLQGTDYPDREEILRRLGDGVEMFDHYSGFPGPPNPDRSDTSGYALSVRGNVIPPQMVPGLPPPPGMQPLPPAGSPQQPPPRPPG